MDDFSPDLPHCTTEVSFLSHCHTDHMKGLEGYAGRIICSKVTREILLRLRPKDGSPRYGSVAASMETYPMEEACTIEVGSRILQFTMIDANHCSGAVMFLFEWEGKAVLFTGDTRAEPWFVNSLVRNPSLMPYMKGFRQLESIYADSTFSYRLDHRFRNNYIEFPTNTDGTRDLLKEIEKYSSNTKFYFATTNVMGFEDVWLMIYHKFNEKVYMNKHHWEIFKAIAPYSQWSRELLKCLTNDSNSRFHGTCDRFCRCYNAPHRVRVVPVTNKTSKEIQQDAQPIRLNNEYMKKLDEPSFSVYYYDNPEPFYTEADPNKNYILSKDKDCYLRTSVEFQYSRHSSMNEMVHFVSIFHPKTVYPFTATRDDYLKGFRMEPIFGNVCDSVEFDYDVVMANDELVARKEYILKYERDKLEKAAEKKLKGEVCDYAALSHEDSDTDDGESEEIHMIIAEQNRRKKRERTLASKQNTEQPNTVVLSSEPQQTLVKSDPNKILSSQVHENGADICPPPLNIYEQVSDTEQDTQQSSRKDSPKRQSDKEQETTEQPSKKARLQEVHANAVLLRRTKTVTEQHSSGILKKLTESCPDFFGKWFKPNSPVKDEEGDNFHFEEISKLRRNLVEDECHWFEMSFDFEKG